MTMIVTPLLVNVAVNQGSEVSDVMRVCRSITILEVQGAQVCRNTWASQFEIHTRCPRKSRPQNLLTNMVLYKNCFTQSSLVNISNCHIVTYD